MMILYTIVVLMGIVYLLFNLVDDDSHEDY